MYLGRVVFLFFYLFCGQGYASSIFPKGFREVLQEKIKEKLIEGDGSVTITYRDGKTSSHREVVLYKTVDDLNHLVESCHMKFTLNKNARIYLEIEPKFFDELWKTDFPSLLVKRGLTGWERNKECPHMTLIGAASIDKIKKACLQKHGLKGDAVFVLFIQKQLKKMNAILQQGRDQGIRPIHFTKLTTKRCQDYPPFEGVITARLHSPLVEEALEVIEKAVRDEFKITIKTAKRELYHVTIAVKYRP